MSKQHPLVQADELIRVSAPLGLDTFAGSAGGPGAWPHFLTGQPEQPVRVLLVDDDPCIRRVITQELLGDLRVNLVGQAGSLREGRRLVAQHEFQVLLVDLNLGDGTGFELIEHMKRTRPVAEAVVVSAMEDEEHAIHAFELGATGYLVKSSWFGSFAQAVLQVVNGGASITPNLARRLLHRMDAKGSPEALRRHVGPVEHDTPGGRLHQPGDGHAPVHSHADRQHAHQEHLSQAARAHPGPSGQLRHGERLALTRPRRATRHARAGRAAP